MLNVCIRKHLLITYTLSYNIPPQTSLERSLPVVNSVIIPLPGLKPTVKMPNLPEKAAMK